MALYVVLLRGIQLTFVQRSQQLLFLIHYCCDNTRKVRDRRSGTQHMYWSHFKVIISYDNPIFTVEPQ
jgi:hypothetical protein